MYHDKVNEGCKDNELYALLNIALNSKYLHCVWQDLRLIYKVVSKNTEVVEFKTKVDLFSACAKFITNSVAKVSSNSPKHKKKNQALEYNLPAMIDKSLKALVYCLTLIIKEAMAALD